MSVSFRLATWPARLFAGCAQALAFPPRTRMHTFSGDKNQAYLFRASLLLFHFPPPVPTSLFCTCVDVPTHIDTCMHMGGMSNFAFSLSLHQLISPDFLPHPRHAILSHSQTHRMRELCVVCWRLISFFFVVIVFRHFGMTRRDCGVRDCVSLLSTDMMHTCSLVSVFG